ncbi:MAG: class I SAM-dependent methyltransferase [Nitrospirota bacterium]
MDKGCLLCNFKAKNKAVKIIKGCIFKKCPNCGLIYLDPQPDENVIEEFYPEQYFHSQHPAGYHDFIARKNDVMNYRLKAIVELVNNLNLDKGRLLEIGCALGYLLELAQDSGWEAQGVELSPWASDYARQTTKVKVFTGKLEEANFQNDYFDAIVMIELIEHIPNPRAFLKEVYRILKPGGLIFITTPNSKSIHTKLWNKRFQEIYLIPEHLFSFSIPTIKRILELTDFKVVHLQTKTYLRRYYDYQIPLGLFRQIRGLGRRIMLRLFNNLNLGEMLVVGAKKEIKN